MINEKVILFETDPRHADLFMKSFNLELGKPEVTQSVEPLTNLDVFIDDNDQNPILDSLCSALSPTEQSAKKVESNTN